MHLIRYIAASFIAPLAALLIPILIALSELYGEAVPLPDGTNDDGAIRGAGLFLVIGLPVLFVVSATFYAALAHILVRLNRLTLKATLSVSGLAPWLLVALATAGLIFNNRSILPGLFMLGVIGVGMSICAMLGAVVWWFIAIPKATANPSINTDAAR